MLFDVKMILTKIKKIGDFMAELIKSYTLGDMTANYVLNDRSRAVLCILPEEAECELLSAKNIEVYNNGSLVHLQLSHHNAGFFSNSFKLSESLETLKFKNQEIIESDEKTVIVTTEESDGQYGIKHYLTWYKNEKGFEVKTKIYNNSENELVLEYLTSASLDAISPYLKDEGSKDLFLHKFKAGWSMEGLHQCDSLSSLGLESAWGMSGESLKLFALGSRAVREYHPYIALEDRKSGVIWGMYLAHNASWQAEITRVWKQVSISIGLADSITGHWSKKIKTGESFTSPTAYITVAKGSIAESSNRLLSMRHREIEKLGVDNNMDIAYNDFVTTWGKPTEKAMLNMADLLSRGKTKYLVMDAGWYTPYRAIGDWEVDKNAFPNGMKYYCDEVKKRGMIPGIWMEFECTDSHAQTFGKEYDRLKLKKQGNVIVGHVINGRRESFFDFSNPEVIEYLDQKVIKFLRDSGFGYLKIDYNATTGAVIDGDESGGENLRQHMERVRDYIKKISREVPNIVIENCASGGCRLEPSMMDITSMSSASDTHEGYEAAVVAANLHYLTPPRQNQVWSTLKPEYSSERFSFIISQGFLGRLCWSGLIAELSEDQLNEMFKAEELYSEVAPIIKKGDSYIYRTDSCSFYSPTGTQAVVRYSEDYESALCVVHSFEDAKCLEIDLKSEYKIEKSLYNIEAKTENGKLILSPKADFCGNVYLLKK